MNYENDFLWHEALKLSIHCYKLTMYFPQSEILGLTSEIRKCSKSITSTIAKSCKKKNKKKSLKLLNNASNLTKKLETLLIISYEVKLTKKKHINLVLEEADKFQMALVLALANE